MNKKSIESLLKESLYSLQLNPKLKDSAIQKDVTDMSTFIKRTAKSKSLAVFVIEE